MSKPRIILLADDDMEDQEILKEAIYEMDPEAEMHSVLDGIQAIKYLVNCTDIDLPCLIILDYKMPGLDAAQVLDRICDDPRYISIPKVVWSSSKQPEHMQICKEKGASNYFVKPAQAEQLKAIARRILEICDNPNKV